MASRSAQKDWFQEFAFIEGVSSLLPFRGSVIDVLKELIDGIVSGFSYQGARTIAELQKNAEFVVQTFSGLHESMPRY